MTVQANGPRVIVTCFGTGPRFLRSHSNSKDSPTSVADPGISKPADAVEFLGLGFVLMPLHTYPMIL